MKFAADENLDNAILRGLRRLVPDVDIVRIQDTEMFAADDPAVLEWCASQQRVLLTHDVRTMTKYAYERVLGGLSMPGVIEIPKLILISVAIADLEIIATCSEPSDWNTQVWYLPLR